MPFDTTYVDPNGLYTGALANVQPQVQVVQPQHTQSGFDTTYVDPNGLYTGTLYGGTEQAQSVQQPQEEKPWYNNLFHGGGSNKMTDQELQQYASLANQARLEENEDVKKQLQERMSSITNQDRGGYLGALGRALTGNTQTGGEAIAGGALKVGIPLLMELYKQRMMNQMGDAVMNRNTANNNAMYNQMLARMR